MVRLALLSAGLLGLSACDNPPPTGEPGGPIRSDQPAAANGTNEAEAAEAFEAGQLPPQGTGPRFVGQWAVDQASCEAKAWLFTDSTLHTPAGSTCSFNRVTVVPGGYDIQATCSAEAPPTSDTLRIRFDEAANAMRFESETIADSTLGFCGRVV